MLLVGVRSALWSGLKDSIMNINDTSYSQLKSLVSRNFDRPFIKSSKPDSYPSAVIIEPGTPFTIDDTANGKQIKRDHFLHLSNNSRATDLKDIANSFILAWYDIRYNVSSLNEISYYSTYFSYSSNTITYRLNDDKFNRDTKFDISHISQYRNFCPAGSSSNINGTYQKITENEIYLSNNSSYTISLNNGYLNINDYIWRLQAILSFYDDYGWLPYYSSTQTDTLNKSDFDDLLASQNFDIRKIQYSNIVDYYKKNKSNNYLNTIYIPDSSDSNRNDAANLFSALLNKNYLTNIEVLDKIIDRLKAIATLGNINLAWTKNGNEIKRNELINSSPNEVIKYVEGSNSSSINKRGTIDFDKILAISNDSLGYRTLTFDGINYFDSIDNYNKDTSFSNTYMPNEYNLEKLTAFLSLFVSQYSNMNVKSRKNIVEKIGMPYDHKPSDYNLYETLKTVDRAIPIYEVRPTNPYTSYAIFSKSLLSLMMSANIKTNLDATVNDLGYDSYNILRHFLVVDDIYLNLGFCDGDNYYVNYYPITENNKKIIDFKMTNSFVPNNYKKEIKILARQNPLGRELSTPYSDAARTITIDNHSYYISILPRRYMIFSLEEYNDGASDYNWTYKYSNNILTCTRFDQNVTVKINLLNDISSHDIRRVFENIANETKETTPSEGQSELDVFVTRLLEWSRNNGGIFIMPLENSFLLIPTALENTCYTIGSYTQLSEDEKYLLKSMQNTYYASTGESSGTTLIDSSEYIKYAIDGNSSPKGLNTAKNKDNIRELTVDDRDMLYMDDESLYKGTALSQDRLVNQNFIAQSLRSVIGLPFQFMPHVDPRIYADYSAISGKGGGYGYHFIDKIIYDLPIAIIKPGQPRAENADLLSAITGSLDMLSPERVLEFQTAVNKKVSLLSSSGINTIIGTIGGAINAITSGERENFVDSLETIFFYLQTRYQRLYTWAGDSAHYIQYVNTLCHLFITFLGIGDMDYIDGHGNTRKYRNYDDSWIVLNKDDDRSLFSVDGESREGFANSEDSELYTINSIFGEDPAVYIFYNAETRTGDMFSNSMQESMISGLNSVSDQSKQIHFLSGIGGQGATNIFNLASNTVHSLAGSLGDALGSGVLGSLFQNVAEGVDVIIAGNNFDVPQMWSDSSHSTDVSISFKLASPSGDLESIFLYILRPLARVLAFSLPRQYVTNSYTSPFIIQAFAKGMFNVQLGVVESLSISRGGDGTKSYTITNLPTELNVQLTIKDMYEKIALSNEYRHDGTIFNLFPDLSGGNTFAGFGLSGLVSKLTTGNIETFTQLGSAIKTSVETTASNFRSFGYLLNNIGLIDFCASYTGFNLNNPAGRLQSYLFRNMIANRYKDIVDVSFDDDDIDIAFPSWERRKADILDNVFLSKSRLIKG